MDIALGGLITPLGKKLAVVLAIGPLDATVKTRVVLEEVNSKSEDSAESRAACPLGDLDLDCCGRAMV